MDYYASSYAMHLSQLLYAKVAEKDDPVYSAEFKKRGSLLAWDLIHYFDTEGSYF
jgi:hypothetical protein